QQKTLKFKDNYSKGQNYDQFYEGSDNNRRALIEKQPSQSYQNPSYRPPQKPPLNVNKGHSIPFEQLKRAVTHNLPCFYVQFDNSLLARELPSAVIAGSEIYKHFINDGVSINKFSMVSYAGMTNKWPLSIFNKNIKVNKPKSIAAHFSLVIRYVPKKFPTASVLNEIKKSITSAQDCNPIVYAYDRTTTDYRFNVKDLEEYYETLNLGKLAGGNRLLLVTPYLPSNKLTYCSKCYMLGHTSLNCNSQHSKCRVCLGEFTNNHRNECEGQFKCAQCGGNHFSLDGNCPMVKNHCQELNKEVKQAIRNGDLNYNTQLKQIKKSNEYQYDVNAFPPLIKMDRNIDNRWSTQKADSNNNTNKGEVADVLKEINKNLEMMKKKLDNQKRTIESNEENIILNKLITSELLTTMANLMGEVMLPLLKLVTKDEEVMIKKTEGYAKRLISMEENLRLNYNLTLNR
ncbi:unnamed protein product, partial [Didymodactylos carnosus]